jgi:DNA replication licensing factor MCM6
LRKAVQLFVKKYHPEYVAMNVTNAAKEFYVSFHGLSMDGRIRDLHTNVIGQLMKINGTVTRTSEVRPELMIGTFLCLECRTINRDVEQQFKFTEV